MAASRGDKWWRHKANLLLVIGLGIAFFELINAEVLGRPFHAEFLVFAGALCGAWTTQLGDKK